MKEGEDSVTDLLESCIYCKSVPAYSPVSLIPVPTPEKGFPGLFIVLNGYSLL